METVAKVIMVDDDPSISEMIKMSLEVEGFSVVNFLNPLEALENLKTNQYDIIVLDYFMPEMTGEEFTTELRSRGDKTAILLQTGYAEEDHPIDLLRRMDIQGYFDKTRGVDELVLLIYSMIKTIAKARE